MSKIELLDYEHAAAIFQDYPSDAPPPHLAVSPWVAASLLQKAIRRDLPIPAMRAAATLLDVDPARFWRRLLITAFEEVSVGNPGLTISVAAACQSKAWRTKIGGEWRVAAALIQALAASPKCRVTDDLAMVLDRHPKYRTARLQLPSMPLARLLDLVNPSADMPCAALALWEALGTRAPTWRGWKVSPDRTSQVFGRLGDLGAHPTLLATARFGFQRTREVICAWFALLAMSYEDVGSYPIEDDKFPPVQTVNSVPLWALDWHTREGRAGLSRFASSEAPTARWLRASVPKPERLRTLGLLLFQVESGLVRYRLRWPLAEELRHLADRYCQGPHLPDAIEGLELLRADIPLLNEVRAHG
jgi:hypothetical protein